MTAPSPTLPDIEAGATQTPSAKELDFMRHALGMSKQTKWKSYRNYFAAAPEGDDILVWRELERRGLAIRSHSINSPPHELEVFHVTEAGKALCSP